jgi:hypothetical protein
LRIVAERAMQFACRVKTAKLHLHNAGARGKGPRIREVASGADGIIFVEVRQKRASY